MPASTPSRPDAHSPPVRSVVMGSRPTAASENSAQPHQLILEAVPTTLGPCPCGGRQGPTSPARCVASFAIRWLLGLRSSPAESCVGESPSEPWNAWRKRSPSGLRPLGWVGMHITPCLGAARSRPRSQRGPQVPRGLGPRSSMPVLYTSRSRDQVIARELCSDTSQSRRWRWTDDGEQGTACAKAVSTWGGGWAEPCWPTKAWFRPTRRHIGSLADGFSRPRVRGSERLPRAALCSLQPHEASSQ